MPTATSIGNALRNARKARGQSLSEVASAAGISTATLSRIETEKQNVDVALFLSLARILRVPPAAILGHDDGPLREDALAHTLAALPTEKRARVIAEAAQARRSRRTGAALQSRLDGLLATVDLIREELADLQQQVSRRRR